MFAKFDPDNIPEIVKCGPMKLGKCYVEDVIRMNPYQEISGYVGDVLIVHGTKDTIVNVKYAETAYETYLESRKQNNASNKVKLHIMEGGAHGFSKKHDAIAIGQIIEFVTGK